MRTDNESKSATLTMFLQLKYRKPVNAVKGLTFVTADIPLQLRRVKPVIIMCISFVTARDFFADQVVRMR